MPNKKSKTSRQSDSTAVATTAKPTTEDSAAKLVYPDVSARMRRRVSLSWPEDAVGALQSFGPECDINNIVANYHRTGEVPVRLMQTIKPQYGEVPESDLFDAARAQAAIRSAEVESDLETEFNPQPDPPEPGSDGTSPEPAPEPAPAANAAPEASEAGSEGTAI